MSMMLCCLCQGSKDTDDDPDGFYCEGFESEFVCKFCRDNNNIETKFDN